MLSEDSIVIPGDGKHLADIRKFIDRNAKKCGFNDDATYDIKVATGEACSNAIEHGSPKGRSNKVEVVFKCQEDLAVIIVKDEGKFKRRVIEYDADGIHHRGRGIDFMLALMDEVKVETVSDGTVVTMKKLKSN